MVLQLGGLGLGGGLPLLPLSHSVFFYSYGSVMRRVEQKENGIWLFVTQKYIPPTLSPPGLCLNGMAAKRWGMWGVPVCARARTSVFRLFANTVQPNRREVTFCGGVCPVPMAEFVRSVPLDNKSCYRWQLKQVLHSL